MNIEALAKERNWDASQCAAFSTAHSAAITNSKDEEAAMQDGFNAVEKLNASDYPKFYYARHMQPGLAGYKNETLKVDAGAIKAMAASMAGKPIYINHRNVDLSTVKADASGFVAESFWNDLDGWLWAKMLLIDDDAKACAESGRFGVSNAYVPRDWTGSGLENNIPYTRAITAADFTHLAIVEDPRYEQAKIFTPEAFRKYQGEKRQQMVELQNSKEKDKLMPNPFKFLKTETKQVEATEVDNDTVLQVTNDKGETFTHKIADMIAAVLNAGKTKKNESEDDKEKLNEASKVKVGDEEMTVGELMNRFTKANSEESEEDKEKAKENAKAKEEAEKLNAKEAEDKRIAEAVAAALTGKTNFETIANANETGKEKLVTVDTTSNKLARGNARYGSGK